MATINMNEDGTKKKMKKEKKYKKKKKKKNTVQRSKFTVFKLL